VLRKLNKESKTDEHHLMLLAFWNQEIREKVKQLFLSNIQKSK
jgi:hypothetical protein